MSYTPTSRKNKISYPPPIYIDSSYASNNYRSSYGGSNNTSSLNNKLWKEISTGKYSSNKRNSTTSSAIEEEVRNMYDQVALQVRRGDSYSMSAISSQYNSNYSKSEKSFVNFFKIPKPPRSYGFSENSDSHILSSLQSPPVSSGTTSSKNKLLYSLPYDEASINAFPIDNDKETTVPGMIFFVIGFILFPFWWFASIIPFHPNTEKEVKWKKINRYATIFSIIIIIGLAVGAFILFKDRILS